VPSTLITNLLGNIDLVSANLNDSNEKIEIQTFVVIGYDVSVQDFLLFLKWNYTFFPKQKLILVSCRSHKKNVGDQEAFVSKVGVELIIISFPIFPYQLPSFEIR
jgi:hypothetical protein